MQSIGFCFAISPIGKKLFKSPEKRKDFLNRHLNFFNAHPYFSSYALGAITRIEEELADEDKPDYEKINRFKSALIGPLGAIGDQLFWVTLKPASILIGLIGVAVLQDIQSKIIFIFLILVLYNIPHVYIRIFGIFIGYKRGFDVYKIINTQKYEMIRNIYGTLGITALGIYISFSLLKYGSTDIINAGFLMLGMLLAFIMTKWKQSVYKSIIFPLIIGTVIGYLVEYL
jgi:mannose/fructose/N-acetylgalactosamine-specific phosphotransferase system component IID